MELAKEACRKQQTCEEDQCNKENISPINDITQNNSNSLDHIILNNELSPEDFDFSAETTSENEHFDSEWYSSEENEESVQTVVFTDNQDDSGLNVGKNAKLNNTFEFTEKQKKLKKIEGINKRTVNKQLRMQALSETSRQTIFNPFWTELNWAQRKIYVANSVKRISPKRPRISNETSRRTGTLQYEVNVNNKAIRVCKKMYLNTLCLGEWSVRNWASESINGMSNSSKNKVSKRQKRKDIHEESRQFLREFLENLHKLPSHYCRKDTEKMTISETLVLESASPATIRRVAKASTTNVEVNKASITPKASTILNTHIDEEKETQRSDGFYEHLFPILKPTSGIIFGEGVSKKHRIVSEKIDDEKENDPFGIIDKDEKALAIAILLKHKKECRIAVEKASATKQKRAASGYFSAPRWATKEKTEVANLNKIKLPSTSRTISFEEIEIVRLTQKVKSLEDP
ncbi:hypothetical protein JTB14_002408 [Gonioctena quinquepunctata]|nr:hypothetical protein JTB14_002408 [Gonioctena quinquepunctata]